MINASKNNQFPHKNTIPKNGVKTEIRVIIVENEVWVQFAKNKY